MKQRVVELKAWVIKHKKQVAIAAVLMIVAGGAALALRQERHPISRLVPKISKNKKSNTKNSPLTGLAIEPARAERPITGVVIENHQNARPQSGLAEAGVVYEALAEGGITRFLAFFLENRP